MTQALSGQPDNWFAMPDGLQAVNVSGYTAYLLPGTDQVAQSQQPPPPAAGCDEDCGSGGGGGGQGQGRHKKHR